MATPIPRIKIAQFSAGENRMVNLAIRRFVVAAEKGDVQRIYNPPTLRVAACSARYNAAFDAAWREEMEAALGPPETAAFPAIIAATIVANIVGNIIGNVISQKVA